MRLTMIPWHPGYVKYRIDAQIDGENLTAEVIARKGELLSPRSRKKIADRLRHYRAEIRQHSG